MIEQPDSEKPNLEPERIATTPAILVARGGTHGEFRVNSEIVQSLKRTMRAAPNWNELSAYQAEALEMIAHKVGRILAGDPHFQDHWDDLDGYAKLAADRNREDHTK